jgi:ankyrin repeat protein
MAIAGDESNLVSQGETMKCIKLPVRTYCLYVIIVFSLLSSGCGSLLKSVKVGDLDEVTRRIEKGEDVNAATSFDRWTPLLTAANYGHYEIAKYLISKGAKVNHQATGFVLEYSHKITSPSQVFYVYRVGESPLGFTPLTASLVGEGQWDLVVALLLEKGADPNVRYLSDDAGPVFATINGRLSYAERSSVVPPHKEQIDTPLTKATKIYADCHKRRCSQAVLTKYKSAIELLLKYKADKSAVDGNGDTAYAVAVRYGLQDALVLLKPE